MRRDRSVGVALAVVAFGSGLAACRGADSQAEATLKEKGLARSGKAYVIEAETPVLAKMKDVRAAFAAYATASDRQAKAAHADEQVAQLEERRVQLQENLDGLNERINLQANPQANGFGRPGMMNPQQAMLAPMINQRDQVKSALNEIAREQKALKAQASPGKDKAALGEDVKAKGEAFKAALAELRPQVDAVTKSYAELTADESVQKALTEVKKASPAKLRLGPSDAFLAGAKELDAAEQRFLGKKATAASSKKKTRSRK